MTDMAADADELLDLDAWDRLEPIEAKQLELVDGIVIVTPRPSIAHSRLLWRIGRLLEDAGAEPVPETEVVIDDQRPATVRVPDLVLAKPAVRPSDPRRFQLGEVFLVVEIVSRGSRRTDYIAKRYDYEQAGVPYYWIVDPGEQRISCLMLVDGHYRDLSGGAGETVLITEPYKIACSWSELLD